jgi:hypothetical protein
MQEGPNIAPRRKLLFFNIVCHLPLRTIWSKLTIQKYSGLTYDYTCSEDLGVELRSLEPGWCGIYHYEESSWYSTFQSLGQYHSARST